MKYLVLLLSLSIIVLANPVIEKKEKNLKFGKKIEIKNDYEENKIVPKLTNKPLKDFEINVSGQVRYRYEF